MRLLAIAFTSLALAACSKVPESAPSEAAPVAGAPAPAGEAKALTAGGGFDPIGLYPGTKIVQAFANCGGMTGLRLPIAAWGKELDPYTVKWTLSDGTGAVVKTGSFETTGLKDWQSVPIDAPTESPQLSLELTATSSAPVNNQLGFGVQTPLDLSTKPVTVDGNAKGGAIFMMIVGGPATACTSSPNPAAQTPNP